MYRNLIIGIILTVACILFFSFRSGDIGSQFTGDENFYFQSAKNMLTSNDWLTPRYFGRPRFQKPILYYWLIAASFKIFGINWYAARFPSIIMGSLIIVLAYLIGQALFKNTTSSLLSAVILATTFKFFKYTRTAIPDMVLLFFVTLSLYIFIGFINSKKRIFLFSLFFVLALATLTKGPIGLIIPLLSMISFSIFSRERLFPNKTDVFYGILIYILVAAPWFLTMLIRHGDAFISQIWSREIAHRVAYYSDTKKGLECFLEYLGTLFFYIPIVIVRFLPWSIFIPAGLYNSFSISRSSKSENRRGHMVLLSWFFTVFLFFTFLGEKHSQYMLALTVPFALIAGESFSRKGIKALITGAIIALITASAFLIFLSDKEFRLNNAIIGGYAARIPVGELSNNDRIGMGSHELIPQQLEVYLDKPVEKIGIRWYDKEESDRVNKLRIEEFFKPGNRAFCIISKEDFSRYVSPELKARLKIIHKDFLWDRKIRLTRDKIGLLLRGRISEFISSFKKEYCLVAD